MGCDFSLQQKTSPISISIHAPIVGCDFYLTDYHLLYYLFQSTHPSWGATFVKIFQDFIKQFQSTHPSWGATSGIIRTNIKIMNFNPRTHRGVRQIYAYLYSGVCVFQSTHPSWGATVKPVRFANSLWFQSTHPSWGATSTWNDTHQNYLYFNPRTHRGVRQVPLDVVLIL